MRKSTSHEHGLQKNYDEIFDILENSTIALTRSQLSGHW